MVVLPFGEYRPDVSDVNGRHTQDIVNVLPRGDGYGPFPSLSVYTSALPDVCRGAFIARTDAGDVKLYAGTADRLYVLDNTTLTWSERSAGGNAYTPLASNANWSFAQFGNQVIATHVNDAVQAVNVNSTDNFADLAGSPPQAAHVAVINRFLVLSGIQNAPRRVQWSGLNAITTWTSGTAYSDYQDLPDGGSVFRVVGGEFGVILQQQAIRRMIFSPGSDIVFQIDRLAKDIGTIAPWSVVEANSSIFFLSQKGFVQMSPDGGIRPIGYERVDRTFLAAYDAASPQLVMGASDPSANVILWSYRSAGSVNMRADAGLAYNYVLDRWSPYALATQYLAPLGKPGVTLEGLGSIGAIAISNADDNGSGLIRLTVSSTSGWSTGDIKDVSGVGGTTEANGTWTITVINGTTIDLQGSTYANGYTSGGEVAGSIDDLPGSLDDYNAAALNQIGGFDSSNRLGFLTGAALEATLTTSEQSGGLRRMFVRGMHAHTDATGAFVSIGARETAQAAPAYSDETAVNAQGYAPARVSTRLARGKLRVPAATSWMYATGLEPDYRGKGRR